MSPSRPVRHVVAATALALALAACGGDQADEADGVAPGGTTSSPSEPVEGAPDPSTPPPDDEAAAPVDLGDATVILGGKVLSWAPAWVGVCEGFFEQHGLRVEVISSTQGTTAAIAALVGRDVLAALTGAPPAMAPIREGAPVQAIFNANVGYGIQVVVSADLLERTGVTPDSPIEDRIAALEGQRVAILNPGDAFSNFLAFALPQFGLDPETDIETTAMGNYGNMIAAMTQGTIDVFGASPPGSTEAEAQGMGQILLSANEIEGLDQYPYLIGTANTTDIEQEPERLVALLRGLEDAMRFLRDDPDGARPCLREEFAELNDEVFEEAYNFAVQGVPASPLITPEAFDSLVEFAEQSGEPIGVSYDEAVAHEFVNGALAR